MEVGFYGKLPSHGDFIRRRISDGFVDAWDRWLRESLAASHTALGLRWLDVYLTSPAWRFVCAAGACGPRPVMGLVAPSVDQVGRYFPITLACELPERVNLVAAATASSRFFDSAEQIVIETLAAELVDFDRFDAGVLALQEDLEPVLRTATELLVDPSALDVLTDAPQAWQLPLDRTSELASVFEQMLSFQLEAKFKPLVLWWTDGSTVVEPSCLVVKGLPKPAQYAALLDGGWRERQWRPVPSRAADTPLEAGVAAGLGLSFRSAAATDTGRARTRNEDSFVDRPDVGIWAVADGMGGHARGEVASRMVCDALADFQPNGTLDDVVEAASQRICAVNDYLLRGAGEHLAERSGSTVAVLLLRGVKSAVLWAGDSRVYRWRDRRLEQLSRDHSLAELIGGDVESNVITRAVGIEAGLRLDLHRDAVRPEDRFLLCSDGLSRVVSEAQISAWMESRDIQVAVDGLIKTTLDAGAPDNVTVLIAEVCR